MSYNAMGWAAHQDVPDCESKLLLMMLSEHASVHDSDPPVYTCWPGIERLCRECLLSENTVKSRLKILASLGIITITPRKDEDGRNRSNLYTLLMSPDPGGSSREGVGVARRGGEGSPHDPEPVIGTSKLNQVLSIKRKGSLEECIGFCKEIGLPESDGEWFFNKCEGNGWTNNKQPIKDWRATIRAWRSTGYMASQRQRGQQYGNKTNFGTGQQSPGIGAKPDYSKGF